MNKPRTKTILTIIGLAAFIGILAILDKSGIDRYYIRILQFWSIYIIFGASFQLLYGYTGLLSLGHAGLIAIGSYAVALLTLSPKIKAASFLLQPPIWPISVVEWPLLPALIAGGLLAALAGLLVAMPALRLGGDYLAMVTLGFAEVIRMIVINLPTVFNGAMGLRSIPQTANLVWTWSIAIVCIFVMRRLETSSFGRALLAISEDEIGSEALGISLFRHKILAFVISSFFAGIGGGLMASVLGTIDANTFKMVLTNAAITIVVLGGMRSLTGVVIASGIYTIMSEYLRVFETPAVIAGLHFPGIPGMRVEIFGFMLLFLMLFMRNGMLGSKEFSWGWLFSKIMGIFTKKKDMKTDMEKTGGTL
jgi:branched-chain amino acid transport system permease protein